ncbi:MAG: T9SS type A sorting domain-containing protein [Chitinophagales bacterium]
MKHTLAFLFFLQLSYTGKAQLYDAQWVTGPNTSILDFRTADTVLLSNQPQDMPMEATNASICDENGNLLFYSNGIYIADRNGDTVLNGSNLSPCVYTDYKYYVGININQGALFIPKPGSNDIYYLFHFSNDTFNYARPATLYYSVIDKNAIFGLGLVISKNNVFGKGAYREGGFTACKHANGRDYWLVMGQSSNNTFEKYLLTPDTILGPFLQSIGPPYLPPYDIAYSKFSLDGSRYATVTYEGYLLVLDFDRCTGEFSNPLPIYNNISTQPVTQPLSGGESLEFSPNGQYIYVEARLTIVQYDLLATNVQDSVIVYRSDSNDQAQISYLQRGPNGKIYCSTWNGGYYFLHVINKPDEKGDSCEFVYAGQPTLSLNSMNLPNLINYRLGPLAGSGCDTISGIGGLHEERRELIISPNPASTDVSISVPLYLKDARITIIDAQGKTILQEPFYLTHHYNCSNWPAGTYFVTVTDGRKSYTGKVVKQ